MHSKVQASTGDPKGSSSTDILTPPTTSKQEVETHSRAALKPSDHKGHFQAPCIPEEGKPPPLSPTQAGGSTEELCGALQG